MGQLIASKYQFLKKPERKWLWLHRQRLKNKLNYLRNSKPRVPKRKASENDDPPPKPKITCTDPNQFPRSARDASWGRSRVVRKAHNFYAKGRKEEIVKKFIIEDLMDHTFPYTCIEEMRSWQSQLS